MIDDLQLEIRRNRRKNTATITVFRAGRIVVSVPTHFTNHNIRELIARKRPWINKKVKQLASLPPPSPEVQFINDEGFLFLGEDRRLKITYDGFVGAFSTEQQIVVSVPAGLAAADQARAVRKELAAWYANQALTTLNDRVEYFAQHFKQTLQAAPSRVGVRYYKSRWGVCKPNGEIVFNWCLIMAPLSVIDYVVVHELCHLRVPNHSRAFWRLVASILPDYKESKRWLRRVDHKKCLAPVGSSRASMT